MASKLTDFFISAILSVEVCSRKKCGCAEMLGSCVGVAVLAMLYEGLKVLREFVDMKLMKVQDIVDIRRKTDDSGCHTPSTEGSKTTVTTPHHDVLGFRRSENFCLLSRLNLISSFQCSAD